MKRFEVKVVVMLALPSLALLLFGLLSTQHAFTKRPAIRIVKNELLIKKQLLINANGQPGKAIYNVEFETRNSSWLEKLSRREALVSLQNTNVLCVDSRTGKVIPSPTSGEIRTTQGRERWYAFYRLEDLRKSSGDLKFTMVLSYLEGGRLLKWPVSLIFPRSKLPK